MIQKPDKPFKSYDEQIEILRSRNLIINNIEFAKRALSNYSYYELVNGIGSNFLESHHPNIFKKGTTIEEILIVQIINDKLRSLILSQILFIEKSLDTKISYLIARKYGVISSGKESYLSKKNFKYPKKNILDKTLSKLNNIINGDLKCRSNVFKHYKRNHNHIPPWILIREITFGNTEFLYKILKSEDKDEIANGMILFDKENYDYNHLFVTSLSLIRQFRNNCAHGDLLLINNINAHINFDELFKVFNEFHLVEINDKNNLKNKNIYLCILSIIYLTNDYDQIRSFLYNLQSLSKELLDSNEKIVPYLSILNLPNDFKVRIQKMIDEIE